jgi:NAD(P)-dependent dehydrogenase (short-subunit alcohol dehydrogenase family)
VSLTEWRTQLKVDVLGQIAATKALLPLLRRGLGEWCSSARSQVGCRNPFLGPSGASKHAIEAIAESPA